MIIRPCDAFIDFKANTASLEEWKNYASAMNFLVALEHKDNLQLGVKHTKELSKESQNYKCVDCGIDVEKHIAQCDGCRREI